MVISVHFAFLMSSMFMFLVPARGPHHSRAGDARGKFSLRGAAKGANKGAAGNRPAARPPKVRLARAVPELGRSAATDAPWRPPPARPRHSGGESFPGFRSLPTSAPSAHSSRQHTPYTLSFQPNKSRQASARCLWSEFYQDWASGVSVEFVVGAACAKSFGDNPP